MVGAEAASPQPTLPSAASIRTRRLRASLTVTPDIAMGFASGTASPMASTRRMRSAGRPAASGAIDRTCIRPVMVLSLQEIAGPAFRIAGLLRRIAQATPYGVTARSRYAVCGACRPQLRRDRLFGRRLHGCSNSLRAGAAAETAERGWPADRA